MANLALALDEIIQQDKKKGFGRGGGIRRPRADGLEAAGVKTSARTRFPQRGFVSGEVPAGRWKHDKFFETYGGGKKGGGMAARKQLGLIGRRTSGTILGGGGKSSGGIAARLARKAIGGGQSGLVKLQISNLPETVVTSDLEELFQEYNCYGVTVHYDESGAHLGTGDLFTDQQSANQILREFKDIAVDGQEICFCIVSESGKAAAAGIIGGGGRTKPTIRDRLRRIGGGSNPIGKRRTLVKKRLSGGSGRVGAARAGAAGRKARMNAGRGGTTSTGSTSAGGKAKTAEELDMELDAYMQKK